MQVILTMPNGEKMHLDLTGRNPKNAEMLGQWLMLLFSNWALPDPRMPLHYQLEIY